MKPVLCPFDRVLFRSDLLMIGEFNCRADEPSFSDTGPIENHILVVPFEPVEIRFTRARSIVADRTRVLLYNRGTHYRRKALNRFGDRSVWLAFDDQVLEDLRDSNEPGPFGKPVERLSFEHYVGVRQIYRSLLSGNADAMTVEEAAMAMLANIARNSDHVRRPSTRRQRQAMAATDEYLARHYAGPVQLGELASEAGISPYHLSRLFRRLRGIGVHQQLVQLRLRDSVERLQESRESITDIAMRLGFSSPSHFGSCFRQWMGTSPHRFRQAERSRCAIF
jgi:AraC-like DNA-binding protein